MNPTTVDLEIFLTGWIWLLYYSFMSLKDKIDDNVSLFSEFIRFIRFRKRYWLLPFLIIVVLLSVFIVLTESSAFAPFIYSLF
jgi:hypothetical protein